MTSIQRIIALIVLLIVASAVCGFGLGRILQIRYAPSAPAAPEPWPAWQRVDPPREDLECWVPLNTYPGGIVCSPKVAHPVSCP
jgi:hypothetical protein